MARVAAQYKTGQHHTKVINNRDVGFSDKGYLSLYHTKVINSHFVADRSGTVLPQPALYKPDSHSTSFPTATRSRSSRCA